MSCQFLLVMLLNATMALGAPSDEPSLIPFQVFSSFDTDTAREAFVRLEKALRPLGLMPVLNVAPYRRSLAMANSEGDAELMRVAELHYLAPDLTDHLIRVGTPIVQAHFYAVFAQEHLITDDIKSLRDYRVGLHKSVLILESLFPEASIHAELPSLYQLLRHKSLDVAIVTGSPETPVTNYENFDESFRVTEIFKMPLYLYINDRHEHLLNKISENLSNLE
ncbi:hypothetical protein [Hahella ganghwensis]|uniref:hypothetical protein n=1 Tax=Hahella ganghwensis TaxID=286420 RepID=UPI00039F75DA|nr:hypothetical protein [Hahella ganghwensis]